MPTGFKKIHQFAENLRLFVGAFLRYSTEVDAEHCQARPLLVADTDFAERAVVIDAWEYLEIAIGRHGINRGLSNAVKRCRLHRAELTNLVEHLGIDEELLVEARVSGLVSLLAEFFRVHPIMRRTTLFEVSTAVATKEVDSSGLAEL